MKIQELSINGRKLVFYYINGNKTLFNRFYKVLVNAKNYLHPIIEEMKIPKETIMAFFEGNKDFVGSYIGNIFDNTLLLSFDLSKWDNYKDDKLLSIYFLDTFIHELVHNRTLDEKEADKKSKEYIKKL